MLEPARERPHDRLSVPTADGVKKITDTLPNDGVVHLGLHKFNHRTIYKVLSSITQLNMMEAWKEPVLQICGVRWRAVST